MMTENHYGLPFDDVSHAEQIGVFSPHESPITSNILIRYKSGLPSVATYATAHGLDALFLPHTSSAGSLDELFS